ncbi:pimeloyl-ACP methyl ester carboxylesterase [Catenulispora sp. GP43]|uniref:alpha/beta fold hydrolase n=1 Tax=Catenulispora sp. GP43 TaxID=3156263 RepID=UPI003513B260
MSEPTPDLTPDLTVSFFTTGDGVRLAYRELGEGRPLVLLHGAMGDGTLWIRHGQAEALVGRGFRVLLPDFRGHGSSAKPRDAAAYPADILTDDTLAFLDHLGLHQPQDYDLGGYSLGARIVVRMLVRGATPGRAVVAGQGMRQVLGISGGAGTMLQRIVDATEPLDPDSQEGRFAAWMRANGDDPAVLMLALDSLVATPAEELVRVQVPTLVAMGTEDERAVSVDELVAALPRAMKATMPGDHGRAASAPEFVAAMVDFLDAER